MCDFLLHALAAEHARCSGVLEDAVSASGCLVRAGIVRINAVAAAQVTVQVGLYGAAVRAWRFLWVHWGANPSAP